MARVVNSRIRLLLLAIVVVFAVLLGRATWIATVRAASLSSFAQAQTKATVDPPRRTRNDLRRDGHAARAR